VKRLLVLALCLAAPAAAADDPYTRGLKALEAGQPRVARVEFMNAIAAAPRDPRPHLMQARTYLLLEDGVAAEAEARRAEALGTPAADTRHMIAEAQLLQADPQAALKTLNGGPTRFPAAAERVKGRAHQALGASAAAALAYSEALRLAPRDHRLWIDIARFRLETGERAGAIAAADRALELQPAYLRAIVLRGVLVRTQYGLKAALPWFDRALALDAEHVPALIERAGHAGRSRPHARDAGRHARGAAPSTRQRRSALSPGDAGPPAPATCRSPACCSRASGARSRAAPLRCCWAPPSTCNWAMGNRRSAGWRPCSPRSPATSPRGGS
jgi:tetratricopeptide (TPR) repeat protein